MTTTDSARVETFTPEERSRLRTAGHRGWRVAAPRLTLPGAWFALVFACLSFLPSLIPRPAVYQGVITGIDASIAYGGGVMIAWLWREFADRDARPPSPRSWRVFTIVAVAALAVAMILGLRWQWQLRRLMGAEGESLLAGVWIPVLAWTIFVALLWLSRGIRRASRTTGRWFSRFMGPRAARATGLVVVALLLVLAVSDVLWRSMISAADSSFALSDQITPRSAVQPSAPERSGSPESLVEWDTLGYQGKAFVAGGPTGADIEATTGAPALEPIRAFAGMDTAEDIEDRVRIAVDDLERAGGFERESLLVATTTGTGWIDPGSAAAFEFITGGDSAIVSVQYSHLPSPLSYLTDQERARDAGRELFDEVFYRWSQLPYDSRPELYVFGESLGSFGAPETAFSGERDLANRLSGAIFVGPPHFNPLYRDFVDDRAPGSAEVEPVYRDGRTIRFTNDPDAPIKPVGEPLGRTTHPLRPELLGPDHLVELVPALPGTCLARGAARRRRVSVPCTGSRR